MNLQTDNDMKRVLLFFSLMLLLGNIKGLAQSIVIDPVMIGTLVYSHQEQQGVLKDIQSEETKIRNFQILIQQKMNQIQSLQEKMYLANLHTSFLCNLIYPTFSRILLYSC